jgi:hypothetical protein
MPPRDPPSQPYVATATIRNAVKGRETDVLRALGIHWNDKSRHIRCPYPDHRDDHPSWRWEQTKARAHCTCTPSASILDVVCKTQRMSFEEAKVWTANALHRPDLIRSTGASKTKQGRGDNIPPDNTATAQQSDGCTLAAYAAAKKLPPTFLRSLGLSDISYLGRPAFKIPYLGPTGVEAAVRFRIELVGNDRFRWRRGSKPLLYGLNRVRDAGEAITIVEGESDCHVLWHAGFPAVGLPGASTWNEKRDAVLFDNIATVYVIIEPDKGGDTVHKWLARSKIRDRVKLVRLDGSKDPSELYLDDPASFAERWKGALAAAVPWRDEIKREAAAAREAAWPACKELALCPNILARVIEAVQASGLVGEERAVKLIYLAAISRLLHRIVSVVVKGPSSGGKSFLVEIVLKLFPPESFYVLTAMSERALAYGEEPLAHRMIVLYEAAGLTGDFATYLFRSLLSEGRICYETVEKTNEGMKPRRIEREGPAGLITTTTAVHLHPENETRLLSLTITDAPDQTKAIMRAQAGRQGRIDSLDYAPWHALQRFLALGPKHVVIPFASELAELIPPVAVRLRRDFPTILALIEAHALLHQASRERNAEGAIVATLEDYSAVREIIADLVSHGIGATVPETVRETVAAILMLLTNGSGDNVSVTSLAKELKLDKSSASRRAKDTIARGYLKNMEDKKGRPARLVIGDPLPDDAEVLPTVEMLRDRCSVAPLREGMDPPPSPMGEGAAEKEEAWTL